MIEVHLMRLESPAAILTRNTTQIAQQLELPRLPNSNSKVFALTIASVVVDVRRTLIANSGHG